MEVNASPKPPKLQARGLTAVRVNNETSRACATAKTEAAVLKIVPGSPVLAVDRITRAGAGVPVELLRRVAASRVRAVHDDLPLTAPA